jgi:Kef-type K+ transport system membrane component KefB
MVTVGLALDSVVLGLTFTTTALGTLLPVLRDAGVIDTEFGRFMMAVGTVGEFGPIVAVALLLTQKESWSGSSPWGRTARSSAASSRPSVSAFWCRSSLW